MSRKYNNSRERQTAKKEDSGQKTITKRTGAKVKESYTTYVDGVATTVDRTVVTGWNVSNRYGLVKLIAVPAKLKDSEEYEVGREDSNGRKKFVKMICKVKHPGPVLPLTVTGFWDGETLHIPDMEMIARPSSPNGGYFGTNYNSGK